MPPRGWSRGCEVQLSDVNYSCRSATTISAGPGHVLPLVLPCPSPPPRSGSCRHLRRSCRPSLAPTPPTPRCPACWATPLPDALAAGHPDRLLHRHPPPSPLIHPDPSHSRPRHRGLAALHGGRRRCRTRSSQVTET